MKRSTEKQVYADPLAPHGAALRDYFAGKTEATITLHSSLGEHDTIPIQIFYRSPDEFFPFERAALSECRGRILDVGAGTGVHSLPLQTEGYDITAVEIVPEAIEILQARGVRQILPHRLEEMTPVQVDTVLMLMNGVGITGTLRGLEQFLQTIHQWVAEDGQILLDSGAAQPVAGYDPGEEWPPAASGYVGEAWITLEYTGSRGPMFQELYVDHETLAAIASRTGWQCNLIFRDRGSYVARLVRSPMAD